MLIGPAISWRHCGSQNDTVWTQSFPAAQKPGWSLSNWPQPKYRSCSIHLHNLPGNFDKLGARLDNAAILQAAGVDVIINGGGSHNARKQRQMAGNAVSYGLPHEAGIAALTSNPARVFGVSDQQGSIQKGKTANVVLWSGDPLDVTSAAEVVVINGKLIPMESRQTKLRDRYLPENPDKPRAYIKP